jgi:integrase
LKPARKAAGLEWVTFHTFRRFLASLLHESRKKTDRQLCDWLGHHDPTFTKLHYVDQMDEGLGDADFLDALIGGDAASMNGSARAPEQRFTAHG